MLSCPSVFGHLRYCVIELFQLNIMKITMASTITLHKVFLVDCQHSVQQKGKRQEQKTH